MGVELFDGSLTNQGDVARAVEGVEVVYHLGAAFQGGGPFTDEEYLEINVRGTLNMSEAAGKAGGLAPNVFLPVRTHSMINTCLGGLPNQSMS